MMGTESDRKGGPAMFTVNNFFNNDDIRILDQKGPFRVVEYMLDLSVTPANAMMAYYCNEMNVRKRQVACDVGMSNVTVQAGAMQWTVGNVNATTGVKGVGDLIGKAFRGSVTGEAAIKPESSSVYAVFYVGLLFTAYLAACGRICKSYPPLNPLPRRGLWSLMLRNCYPEGVFISR